MYFYWITKLLYFALENKKSTLKKHSRTPQSINSMGRMVVLSDNTMNIYTLKLKTV